MWRLFIAFTVIPALELYLLLQIGELLGPTPTFLLLLSSGLLGGWLAKQQGLTVLRDLQTDLQRGLPPASRLMEGALVLAGSLLLITPGVLTDVAGLALLVPPVRRWLAPRAMRWGAQLLGVRVQVGAPRPRASSPAGGPNAGPFASKFD
jgi:UPF0716 protein FxsA